MADNDQLCNMNSSDSDTHVLNAEFTDGQLRIVEVSPFDDDKDIDESSLTLQSMMQDSCNDQNSKLLQVLDQTKNLGMQLDMLNLTLVRCEDSEGTYRLVANDATNMQNMDDPTVTVHLDSDGQMQVDQDTYVMIEGDDGETMILHTYEESNEDLPQSDIQCERQSDIQCERQSDIQCERQSDIQGERQSDIQGEMQSNIQEPTKSTKDNTETVHIKIEKCHDLIDSDEDTEKKGDNKIEIEIEADEKLQAVVARKSKEKKTSLTPLEILEKVKALRKTTALISRPVSFNKRGRKRKGDVPSPQELLASPNLKLYLYSCKMCNFKCNAIKDLKEHRTAEHGKYMKKHKTIFEAYQCDKCPNRYTTSVALEDHIQKMHTSFKSEALSLDSIGVSDADILVCGGCGFESASRLEFKVHIEKEHNISRNFVEKILST